jgi:hypothetical protein
MKLFIVTLSDNREGWQYARSIAALAITLENSKLDIKAIEEIPNVIVKDMPSLGQLQEQDYAKANGKRDDSLTPRIDSREVYRDDWEGYRGGNTWAVKIDTDARDERSQMGIDR